MMRICITALNSSFIRYLARKEKQNSFFYPCVIWWRLCLQLKSRDYIGMGLLEKLLESSIPPRTQKFRLLFVHMSKLESKWEEKLFNLTLLNEPRSSGGIFKWFVHTFKYLWQPPSGLSYPFTLITSYQFVVENDKSYLAINSICICL